MLFRSATTRNEFVDPPPEDWSSTTLILGRERLVGKIVEISIGGFTVLVPRSTLWTGEPIARLVTCASTYNVRIIKQEAKYDGFQFTLLRTDELAPEVLTNSQRWIIYGSRCCAIGLILAIAYCLGFAPGGATRGAAHPVTLQAFANYWLDSWKFSMAGNAAPVTHANSQPVDVSLSLDDGATELSEAHAVSSVSTGADAEVVVDRRNLLQLALNAANSQHSRPLNSTTIPWLIPNESVSQGWPRCRMSHSAEEDLRMFATCLNDLSPTAATEATVSLRTAIASIASSPASAVEGFPTLRLIRSDDADIYFRTVDGEAELLRILPVELKDTVPPRVPSASAKPNSLHR